MKKRIGAWILLAGTIGCAGAPVRPALQENLSVPPGVIEGNRFSGVRYPFQVDFPAHWKVTTDFPEFLAKHGYNRPNPADKERTELYAFNPATDSHVQFDVTPASPHTTFNQKNIEWLATVATDSLRTELDEHYGKNAIPVEAGPTEAASLKGVQYAAKKKVTYMIDGKKHEQGWIYGFTEPYQIFIIYLVLEKEGADDRNDIKRIVESFEWRSKK